MESRTQQVRPKAEEPAGDVAGETTHGKSDPGHDEGEASRDQVVRILDTMSSKAKVTLTNARDQIDECLRGIDARGQQLADDFLSFHDELVAAENTGDSIRVSAEGTHAQLAKHIKRSATVTHIARGTAAARAQG